MPRVHPIRIPLRHTLLVFAAVVLVSQTGAAQTSESDSASQAIMGSSNPRANDTQHHEAGSAEATASGLRDKVFLRQATTSSLNEIQLSQLALQKASDEAVRRLASSVLLEQAKILDGLRSTAEAQGVMLPARPGPQEQAAFERLKGLSGEDFDREYIKALVDDHHRDLRNFRSEAASTQDASLKSFVQDAAPEIHQHVVLADQIARAKGVSVSHSARDVAPTAPQ